MEESYLKINELAQLYSNENRILEETIQRLKNDLEKKDTIDEINARITSNIIHNNQLKDYSKIMDLAITLKYLYNERRKANNPKKAKKLDEQIREFDDKHSIIFGAQIYNDIYIMDKEYYKIIKESYPISLMRPETFRKEIESGKYKDINGDEQKYIIGVDGKILDSERVVEDDKKQDDSKKEENLNQQKDNKKKEASSVEEDMKKFLSKEFPIKKEDNKAENLKKQVEDIMNSEKNKESSVDDNESKDDIKNQVNNVMKDEEKNEDDVQAILIDNKKDDNKMDVQYVEIEKRNKLLKKALWAAGGFVTGLGLSCVPGVGTIKMGIATAKLAQSAISVWSKKYPDGKIASLYKLPAKVKEKYPKIAEKIEMIEKSLKQTPLNVFLNGMAAGYLVGNVFEMVTGNNVIEAIQKANKPVVEPAVTTTTVRTQPVEQTAPATVDTGVSETPVVAPVTETSSVDVVQGHTYDLSSITKGMVSSDASNSVNLLTQAGKDVVFDKEVILPNGTKMWHFKQANGLGYAWFKADEVQAVLDNAAQAGMSR